MVENAADRERLINNNMGLVHACANKFRGRGLEYEDMFQAGCVGLVKAADAFDPSRGFAFSTYAVPVILGEIRRMFRDGGAVKVGRALKKKAQDAMREKERLANLLGRSPTVTELSRALGLELAETAELLAVAQPPLSLTADEEAGGGQIDIPVASPEERLFDSMSLMQVMTHLAERDRELIRLRYYCGLTQSVTAQRLGMTQVQVSRREKSILIELRKKLLC